MPQPRFRAVVTLLAGCLLLGGWFAPPASAYDQQMLQEQRREAALETVFQDEDFLGPNRQHLSREEIAAIRAQISGEIDQYVQATAQLNDRDFFIFLDEMAYAPDGLRDRTRAQVLAAARTEISKSSWFERYLAGIGADRGQAKAIAILLLIAVATPVLILAANRHTITPRTFRLASALLLLLALVIAVVVRETAPPAPELSEPDNAARRNIYFVTPLVDEAYFHAVLNDIRAAKESIYVSLLLLQIEPMGNSPANQLAKALADAAQRGVQVCVLLEHAADLDRHNRAAGDFLAANGVHVAYDELATSTHEKIVMIDRQIIFVSNHNWSNAALTRNGEAAVRIATPRAPRELVEYFNLWFPAESPVQNPGLYRPIADPNAIRTFDVTFLKDSAYCADVTERLSRARKSILVVMYFMKKTDRPNGPVSTLLAELANAAQRRVPVHVVLDDNMKDRNDAALAWLRDHGIRAEYDDEPRIMHTKLVIIDDRYVILGSHNWTPSAFNSNAELSVCILSEELAQRLKEKLNIN